MTEPLLPNPRRGEKRIGLSESSTMTAVASPNRPVAGPPLFDILPEDREDMTFLEDVMKSIQACAEETRFNREQSKLLYTRCMIIFRTLSMMTLHSAPNPKLLSAFRSAEYVLRKHVGKDWQSFLLHRFTASELFEAVREKLRLVWSLQPTTQWEGEDLEAEREDSKANARLMQERGILPRLPKSSHQDHTLTDSERLLAYYHRRRISGWKISWDEVTRVPLSLGMEAPSSPNVGSVFGFGPGFLPPVSLEEQSSMRYFHPTMEVRTCRLSWSTIPVQCLELNPGALFQPTSPAAVGSTAGTEITPKTLEAFIIDMKCRQTWAHPVLLQTLGGFAERFDGGQKPFISLGVVVEDLSHQGFLPLSELLYEKGRRLDLNTCIQIVLQVADAIQYCILSSEDVVPEVVQAWSIVNPSLIFVQFTLNDFRPRVSGGSAAPTATTDGAFESPTSPPSVPSLDCCQVKVLPGFYVEGGSVSRWTPPNNAGNVPVYSLTQLLVCLLDNVHPHPTLETQQELKLHAPITPGVRCSQYLPKQVQELIAMGLQCKVEKPKNPQPPQGKGFFGAVAHFTHKLLWAGVSVDVVEDSARPAHFMSIQHFRRQLARLQRSETVSNLPRGSPTTYHELGPMESHLLDYGDCNSSSNLGRGIPTNLSAEPIPDNHYSRTITIESQPTTRRPGGRQQTETSVIPHARYEQMQVQNDSDDDVPVPFDQQ
jgi:hypothetical protein